MMLPAPHRRVALASLLAGAMLLVACGELVSLGPKRELAEPDGSGGSAGGGGEGGGGGAIDPDLCEGDVLWVRTFGDASYDMISDITPDGEGGVYVSGWFAGNIDFGAGPVTSAGDRDFFVARFDTDGRPLWVNRYGTPFWDNIGPQLTLHPQGVVMCGNATQGIDLGKGAHSLEGSNDAYVALLSPQGELVWQRWIDGAGEQVCWGTSAVDPTDGDVVATILYKEEATLPGDTYVGLGEGDILLVRLAAANGTVVASRALGTPALERPMGLAVMPDRRIVLTAQTAGNLDLGSGPQTHTDADMAAALLEPNLATVWGHVYDHSGDQLPYPPLVTAAGNIVVSGNTTGPVNFGMAAISPMEQGFIVRLRADDGLAVAVAGLQGFDQPIMVRETSTGDFVVAGAYADWMGLGFDSWALPGSNHSGDPAAVKLSSDFQQSLWKQLGASSDLWEGFRGVALGTDSSVFLGGDFFGTLTVDGCSARQSQGDADAYLIKRRL